jgi:hypothetical protein
MEDASKRLRWKLRELRKLQERWLKLRDEVPRVWHCCAVQTGPVLVEGHWFRADSNDGTQPETLGAIKSSVLGQGFPGEPVQQFECNLAEISLPPRENFWLSFWLWGDLFESLINTGTTPLTLDLRRPAERMALFNESPHWFGRCNFAADWPRPADGADALPEAFQELSRDSVACLDHSLIHPQLRISAFSRWLSDVYRMIGIPDSDPQECKVWIGDLRDGDVISIGSDEQTISRGETLSLVGRIPLRGVCLGWDVCMASVKAIDSVLKTFAQTTPTLPVVAQELLRELAAQADQAKGDGENGVLPKGVSLRDVAALLCDGDRPDDGTGAEARKKNRRTVEQVIADAEKHLERNPWPGLKPFARLLECSPSTLTNACKKSPMLLLAKTEHETRSKSVSAKSGRGMELVDDASSEPCDEDLDELLDRALKLCTSDEDRETLRNIPKHQAAMIMGVAFTDPETGKSRKTLNRQ